MNKRDGYQTMTVAEALAQGGVHTALVCREQAPGAWPNGSRVRKVVFEDGDTFPVGTLATVLGSLGPHEGMFGYFVRWDDLPVPVFIVGRKLELLRGD